MYLTLFSILHNRVGIGWISNPYRVHQRLLMAYSQERRLLFRIEPGTLNTTILVQSMIEPEWKSAFLNFEVLTREPEMKVFDPLLRQGGKYRFRLLANPTMTHQGKRLGLLNEEDQLEWINRQMKKAGCEIIGCHVTSNGLQRCSKNPAKDAAVQTHVSVLFEGALGVNVPELLKLALLNGIGSAKGYGFGLLSLGLLVG